MKNKIINIAFVTTICAFLITSIFFLLNRSFNNQIIISRENTQKNDILFYNFPSNYHDNSKKEDLNTTNEDIIYQNYNEKINTYQNNNYIDNVIEVITDKQNNEENIIQNNEEKNLAIQNQNIEVLQEETQNNVILNKQIISNKNSTIISGIVNNRIITIEDRTMADCAQALDFYYQDYYFTCIKSQNVFVIVNENEYTISYALNNKIVTMDELMQIGFKPLKKNNYAIK
ncbi:MAG: hypothetical protein ACI4XR_04455 [Bacilli bacterium]